ncbi:MAG: L,D-transpeptidase family protein [Negativicutes bacterium]|nr:L,D-transpeptidase family protein [Negativicutes bacterium]
MISLSFNLRRRCRLYWGVAIFTMLSLGFGFAATDYLDEQELAALPNQPEAKPSGTISIRIDVNARTLEVYSDDQLYKTYRVAVGKSDTPTPIGEWKVVWKDYNWGTGFGTRWMGLNVPWGTYGIHGTNKPWSIGRYASHGCIRMRNKDVEQLFEWVPIGTLVRIEGAKVRVARTLKHKMSGPDVVIVQLKLRELGFFDGRADGIFGVQTDQAVRNFQNAKGLEVNGIVDRKTREAMGIKP